MRFRDAVGRVRSKRRVESGADVYVGICRRTREREERVCVRTAQRELSWWVVGSVCAGSTQLVFCEGCGRCGIEGRGAEPC